MNHPAIVPVDDAHFDASVLESDRPVVVDFWAAWCPPCRMMDPILGEIAQECEDIRVVSIDVDANQETAARYGVLSMPTFMVFRHGQPVLTLVGSRSRRKFEAELEPVLGTFAPPPPPVPVGPRPFG
jgi:thioredoxin 1